MSENEDQFFGNCVLLVEDDVSLAERLEDLLGKLGYGEVFFADSLSDAEEIAKTEKLDVALLDVNLKDGLQTVGLGRTLSGQGVRVLFMSGFNAEEMSRATQGFEFVEKPLSLSRLKAALQRAFVRSPTHKTPPAAESHP